MDNKIEKMLVDLGVCEHSSIFELYPRVRDRNDVKVMCCRKSGVIFLSRSDHIDEDHYRRQTNLGAWSAKDRLTALAACRDDDERRARKFAKHIRGKRWMDVGAGVGGIMDILKGDAREVCAVELQEAARNSVREAGYEVHCHVSEVEDNRYDVVTLFHVFEHLLDPISTLHTIASKMKQGGTLIIEVPHANDFLISTLQLEAFKKFTFWSEHLILHTRDSLRTFLNNGGFTNIQIAGYQRYPLANHLYWLAKGKPGGHKEWVHLIDPALDEAYAAKLTSIDQTDTLIGIAHKNY